jgi:hypothetical protein
MEAVFSIEIKILRNAKRPPPGDVVNKKLI